MFSIKNKTGATILEALVVIAILIVVFTILIVIFIGQGAFFQKENARLDTALENTRALNDFLVQTREAIAVEAGTTIDSLPFASGPEQLVLKLYSLDAMGALKTSSFDYAVYYRDQAHPNRLMKKVAVAAGSSRTPVTKNLDNYTSALNFTFNNPDFAQVSQVTMFLESAKTVGGAIYSASSTARAGLRNK